MALPVALLSLARFDSARVLAECEAKRRVVTTAIERRVTGRSLESDDDLRALAAVYASHPDFCERWRPEAASLRGYGVGADDLVTPAS
jgi:hypothetical protein